jgi:hypothetical protein
MINIDTSLYISKNIVLLSTLMFLLDLDTADILMYTILIDGIPPDEQRLLFADKQLKLKNGRFLLGHTDGRIV